MLLPRLQRYTGPLSLSSPPLGLLTQSKLIDPALTKQVTVLSRTALVGDSQKGVECYSSPKKMPNLPNFCLSLLEACFCSTPHKINTKTLEFQSNYWKSF